MKLSVLIGVGQMLFGVLLSFANHRHFQKPINIVAEFIPQLIFLMSLFGYMNMLIIGKWLFYTSKESGCAPSILILMINMFLFKYEDHPCSVAPMYSGQQFFQSMLVILALVCIPWMLLMKPFMLKKQRDAKKWVNTNITTNGAVDESAVEEQPQLAEIDPIDVGDLLLTQAIHTIEYCLGSISHTASYLRLWALSLAHAQLSEVLWGMVLRAGLTGGGISGGIIMYCVFAIWATLSVVVLILMEGLSAFLHALRLHWVEFQSKFYHGTGYLFAPFSFEQILKQAAIDEQIN